jgi:hypothetical protein
VLRALLTDPETSLPVVFGVAGGPGTGKTSFLRFFENQLEADASSSGEQRWHRVFLSVRDEHVQTQEQAWAVMVSAMYTQLQQGMHSRLSRVAFRIRLEAARRGTRRFILGVVLPTVLGLVVAVAGVTATIASSSVGWLAPVAAVAGVAVSASTALREHTKALRDPVAWLSEQTVSDLVSGELPLYLAVHKELADLLHALGAGPRRAVLLVDGLDQPEPAQLTAVLGAVRSIRRSADLQLAIVLAMDADLVAASIEASFSDPWRAALRRRTNPEADITAEEHIARVVDLSVVLAAPGPEDWAAVLEPQPRSTDQPPERIRWGNAAELEHISMALLPYLPQPPSPRGLKQFVRAFRLQALLAARANPLDADQLDALARYVLLRRRWPALAAEMDRDPELIRMLDRAARFGEPGEGRGDDGDERAGRWLALGDLRPILADAKVAVSELPLDRFAHVT